MISLYRLLGFWALILGMMAAPSQARNHNHVTFVAFSASEPLVIVKKTRVRGIVTDVVRQIFRETDYELQPRPMPSDKFRRLLESGMDVNWITYGSPKWQRKTTVADIYQYSDKPLFDLRYSLLSSRPAARIEEIQDLIGHRLVLIQGYLYPELEPFLSQDSQKKGIIPYFVTSRSDALNMIRERRADYFLSGTKRAHWTLHSLGYSHDEVAMQDFSHQIPAQPVHLAFNKDAPEELKNLINRRLDELLATDLLPRLIRHYNYDDVPPMPNG